MEENELNKKYQYGWYGTCENECEPLYFNQFSDRDKIESVIRVSVSDGRSFEKFTAYDESSLSWVNNLPNDESFDDYINPQFKHMECGMGYLVVRKTDNFESFKIDGFTIGNYNGPSEGNQAGFVAVDGCPEATPTPTPAPPYIKIETLDVDYNYDGEEGEVLIKFTIRLLETDSWQYKISGDANTYTVLAQNGNAILSKEYVSTPGDFSLTVTGLDSTGKPVDVQNSKDTRFYQVLAPTPTPTPEKTPTPTPTQTPTPSQTPFNCECSPSTHNKIVVDSTPMIKNGNTYVLPVGTEVGINFDEFKGFPASTVEFYKPNGDSIGSIVFTGTAPDSALITLKDIDSGICYEGTADSSNQAGETWVVNMTERVLPGDCQPTPTPKLEDCCDGLSTSTDITTEGTIVDIGNYVTGDAMGVAGKLCWKELPEPTAAVNLSFSCPIETDDFSMGGLLINVQSPLDSSNNRFVLEATDGKCYEAILEDAGDGFNIFRRIK